MLLELFMAVFLLVFQFFKEFISPVFLKFNPFIFLKKTKISVMKEFIHCFLEILCHLFFFF